MQVVGTSMVTNLVPLLAGLMPSAALRALLPARVLANLVTLVSVAMLASAFQLWAGGIFCDPSMRGRGALPDGTVAASDAAAAAAAAAAAGCSGNGDATWTALRFGAPQYIGLGFASFATMLMAQMFACPLLRDGAVLCSLLVAWLVAFLSPQWGSTEGRGAFYPGE